MLINNKHLYPLLSRVLTSHRIKDIVRIAKIYINENRVEVTRKVPMDGKLLLDEELRSCRIIRDSRCAFASAVRKY